MAFVVYCDNKGCGKQMAPLLDPETNKVECTECGKEVKSITQFAKASMKSMGQFKKTKSQKAFAVQCKSCNQEDTPKINSDGTVVCAHCAAHLNYLSAPFVQMLKTQLGK